MPDEVNQAEVFIVVCPYPDWDFLNAPYRRQAPDNKNNAKDDSKGEADHATGGSVEIVAAGNAYKHAHDGNERGDPQHVAHAVRKEPRARSRND